jgi:tRNA(Ile)-lysidine synthase TilS/MesJ
MPAQSLFRGALAVVRPLYYIDKKLIRTCLRQAGIRPVPNPCPYHRTGTRLLVRRILGRLARLHPRTPTNLFWGIHNLKPEYLPRRAR